MDRRSCVFERIGVPGGREIVLVGLWGKNSSTCTRLHVTSSVMSRSRRGGVVVVRISDYIDAVFRAVIYIEVNFVRVPDSCALNRQTLYVPNGFSSLARL